VTELSSFAESLAEILSPVQRNRRMNWSNAISIGAIKRSHPELKRQLESSPLWYF
jgi:hypothetical protein